MDFTDFFYTDVFFHFLRQMPVYLFGDSERMVWSKRPAMLLVRRDINISCFWSHWWNFWEFKFHLKHFPRTSRFPDFYRLNDYFFLQEAASLSFPLESQPKFPRRKHWRVFSWSVERPSSKLLKWDLVYLLNTLGNPSLRIFAAGKASLVWNCRKRKTNTQPTDDVTTT